MRITVPPGQRLPNVSGTITISRSEAAELRDALDLVIAKGSSAWSVTMCYVDVEASVRLTIELDDSVRRSN